MEVFKTIKGYEGLYQVSNLGRVKSLERIVYYGNKSKFIKERILKGQPDGNKYLTVGLTKDSIQERRTIHQLVAVAFLNHKPCGLKSVVNHKNNNKQDNRVENLEIVSQRENGNKKHLKSTSKYIGVHWSSNKKKWVSSIHIKGKTIHLGYFDNEYNAHISYKNKLSELTK